MMNHATRTLLLITPLTLLLTACGTNSAPNTDGSFALPDIPADSLSGQSIPYPTLNEQTQIDHLGIRIARIERDLNALEGRLKKLEPRTKKNTASKYSQRLDDNKLKSKYLADSGSTVGQADNASMHETRLYNQALKFYQRSNYSAAAAVLRESDGGNGSEIARRNMYLLLQSHQHLGNCESVIEIGGRYANRFRNSPQAPEALYSIGQCQYNMQQKDIARSTWRKLIQSYPNSAAAQRAAARIKQR